MSRFSELQIQQAYDGLIPVSTPIRAIHLWQVEGIAKAKDLKSLKLSAATSVELGPATRLRIDPELTKSLREKGMPFVAVEVLDKLAFMMSKSLEGTGNKGLLPKSVFHDLLIGALSPTFTGITYGGYKWSLDEERVLPNFMGKGLEFAKCGFCGRNANKHKLYETVEALEDAKLLLEELTASNWADGSPAMLGVLHAAKVSDSGWDEQDTRVYCAYSGQQDVHEQPFTATVSKLNSSSARGHAWHFARPLKNTDAHLLWNRTDTLGKVRGLPKNGGFTMDALKCAAPKLVQAAHRDGYFALYMSEIWFNPKSFLKGLDHVHGVTVESCQLCRLSLPAMMCERDIKLE